MRADEMNRGADDTVVELRRYRLHPGRRDELIELFERELTRPQEAAGMTLVGQFRDLDHPDTFTWLRSFPDMHSRRRALEHFYGGPVWARHRDAANATMIDSDDVHLLRPVSVEPEMHAASDGEPGVSPGAGRRRLTLVVAFLAPDVGHERARRHLGAAGWTAIAAWKTLDAVNDFPRLPVHSAAVAVELLATDDPAVEDVDGPSITRRSEGTIERALALRLEPTTGSRLR